jgi:CheY-like chemotaxis protein
MKSESPQADGRGVQGVLFSATMHEANSEARPQDRLERARQRGALGQLAVGLAHDLNNLFTVIRGSADLLLRGSSGQRREKRSAERIYEAAERGIRLTGELLAFGRPHFTNGERVDVDQRIQGLCDLLAWLLGKDIELELRLAAAPSALSIDAGELDQILMNLVANAGTALSGGGRLTIETQCAHLDEKSPDLEPGRYVVLTIDGESGLSAEHLPRLFDRFSAPADAGRDLEMLHRIVSRSRGAMSVRSDAGSGTRFEVYLPCAEEPCAEEADTAVQPTAASAETPAAVSPSMLVVEDDELLRDMAVEILEQQGYTVHSAGSPDQALRIARSAGPIDLLLTDVVMPGMPAARLAELLRVQHPRLRVLFMSGYTDAHLADRGNPQAGQHFIRKPFDASGLSTKVAGILKTAG